MVKCPAILSTGVMRCHEAENGRGEQERQHHKQIETCKTRYIVSDLVRDDPDVCEAVLKLGLQGIRLSRRCKRRVAFAGRGLKEKEGEGMLVVIVAAAASVGGTEVIVTAEDMYL